jgi:uncharacterized SAM-binding protein YcdF (DUF218 family)
LPGRKSRRLFFFRSLIVCALGLAVLFSGRILWALGAILVDSENPRKADIVIVLGGDFGGWRVLRAAELVRQGFAPRLLISSGPFLYGRPESELAADYAVSHGYDRSTMICFDRPQLNTRDEALNLGRELRRLGVHSALLVTSPSHTARAARLFRKGLPDIEIHPIAAPDPKWCGGRWWTGRECEKTWFFEAVKSLTGPLGI